MRRSILVVALAMLAVIQAVPYGANHTDPPVRVEPPWDSERTRRLAGRLCFDCHSNETVWPWFSHVAPISWLIQRDMEHGRRVVNFSEWDRRQNEALESANALRSGEMPPRRYLWPRPAVRLSATERQDLLRGLEATLGSRRARTQGGTVEGIAVIE
jgi:hypothetical protein